MLRSWEGQESAVLSGVLPSELDSWERAWPGPGGTGLSAPSFCWDAKTQLRCPHLCLTDVTCYLPVTSGLGTP